MTGASSVVLARLVAMVSAFCLIPFVVHRIGEEAYGLWAVTGSVTAYFALFDCGVGSAFVKYLAEFLERGEHNEARQVATFGLLFYLALGAVVLPAAHLLAPHVVAYLKLHPGYDDTAINLIVLAVGYFVLNAGLGVFNAFIVAMQRSDLAGLISSIGQIVYVGTVVTFIRLDYGVYALPAALFLALGFVTLARLAMVYRMFGSPWRNPLRWRASLVKKLFRFGVWTQISGFTAVINLETDRIILGAFVSVTSVTYYELGNRLAKLSMMLPWAVLSVLLPAASAIDGRGDNRRLNLMYIRVTRYLALTAFLVAGFLLGAGHQILRVWMGREYPYVIPVMGALLLSYVINGLTGVGTMIVRATGQPEYETYYAALGATINIVATIILTPLFGVMGVVGGTLIGQVVGSVYFIWLFHNLHDLGWKAPLVDWLWRLTAGTAAGSATLWFACEMLAKNSGLASRVQGVAALGVLGAAYIAACWSALWAVGFWKAEDITMAYEATSPILARTLKRGLAGS